MVTRYNKSSSWGSRDAAIKESHVARFLQREYLELKIRALSLSDIGLNSAEGSMFDKTKDLMEVHYDQEIDIFKGFLDKKFMAYTMAFYNEGVENDSVSLEEAQENKFSLICERAEIKGNERILNIGCGFGSFELYLLENYPNIEVVGVTPSNIQAEYIREMMKHVAAYLKPGGRAFHHLIVSKITIPQFLDSSNSLIGKYFPGGRVWPFNEVPKHSGSLRLEKKWFVNGMNYWKTLDEWHKRFWENLENITKKNKNLDVEYWNDYFILCKACFLPENGSVFGNGHYLFRKSV